MIIADNGIIIRIKAEEISKIGRNTQGVKVMRMKDEESRVVAFTIVPRQEDEETATENSEQTAENNSEANTVTSSESVENTTSSDTQTDVE